MKHYICKKLGVLMPGNASANAAGCTARSPQDRNATRAELSALVVALREQLLLSSFVRTHTPLVPSPEQRAAVAVAFNAEEAQRRRAWGRDCV